MIIRKTTSEDNAALNALFAVAFETAPENGPAQEDDTRIFHWGAFGENGELMSSLSVTPFSMQFDGSACRMAGVGAVQTLPPYRRKGGVAACFKEALPALYADGFLFSYLFPFSTAFYRRFGYESCVTKLVCKLDLSQRKFPKSECRFALATKECPLSDAILTVDRAWEKQWNMEVLRSEEDYSWLEKIDPLQKQEYLYVCFDSSDDPIGYTAFRTVPEDDGRNLVCSRFRFLGRDGFHALLGVFASLAADHRYAVLQLPSDPALKYLLDEWSLGAAGFSLRPSGMIRVINVREVLARAACRGEGTLSLQIDDAYIPENCGVFTVRFAGGHAVSVEQTADTPDAVLDIAAFSACIAGVCDFDGAQNWMDGLEVRNADAPFASVFYRKSMMISEYF